MAPIVDGLEQEYEGRVDFVIFHDVDGDAESRDFANEHGVSFVPTTLIFGPDGSEVDRILGAAGETALRERIDAVLAE